MMQKSLKILLVFILTAFIITGSVWYGFRILQPTALPEDPELLQQYEETITHVKNIAKDTHPSGSYAIGIVQEYLTTQFDKMDVTYEEMPFRVHGRAHKNYLVKLDVPNTDRGVVFVSHYDSTPYGPGAADDAISVASMLTVIAQVKTRGESTNDMYFLFTDGEEDGLLGAKDFLLHYHKQYEEVFRFVVNLEARGNEGSLLMFETAENDYASVKALQKAVKSGSTPISLAVALYRTMSNDTDFTIFLDHGYQGLNFATIDGGEHYHNQSDTVENLNKDTAYMFLSTASELADYLENADLDEIKASADGVYFPIAKGSFVLTSQLFMNIFSVFAIVVFITAVIFTIVKKRLQPKGILVGAIVFVAYCALTALLSFPLEQLAMKIFVHAEDPYQLANMKDTFYFTLFVGNMVILSLLFFVLRKRIGNTSNHLMVYGTLFCIGGVVMFVFYSEAVYLMSIPLTVIAILMLVELMQKKAIWRTGISMIFTVLLCIVVSSLFTPFAKLWYEAIGKFNDISMTTLVLGLMETIPLCLCLGTVIGQIAPHICDNAIDKEGEHD